MIASLCFGAVAVGLAAWIYRGMTTFTPLPPMRQVTDVLLPARDHECASCEWARIVARTDDDWWAEREKELQS